MSIRALHATHAVLVSLFLGLVSPANLAAGGPSVTIQTVALSDDPAPGLDGQTFNYFYPSALNEVGEVIFSGGVDPLSPSTAISGIWHGRPGELTLVAKESGSAPDSSGGSLAFGGIFGFPQLNDQGEAAFAGDLVDPQGDVAIWSGAVSDLSLVARPGAEAPGTGGEPFQEVLSLFGSNPLEIANPDSLALNALGEVAFLGLLGESGDGFDHGIWSGGGSAPLSLVARGAEQGTIAPDTGGLTFALLTTPHLSDSSKVSFAAFVDSGNSGDNSGIWLGDAASLRLLVREGEPAPETGGLLFGNMGEPVGNASDQVAFVSGLTNGSSNLGEGIWTCIEKVESTN